MYLCVHVFIFFFFVFWKKSIYQLNIFFKFQSPSMNQSILAFTNVYMDGGISVCMFLCLYLSMYLSIFFVLRKSLIHHVRIFKYKSFNPGQKARLSKVKKRTGRVVECPILEDHKVSIKENEKEKQVLWPSEKTKKLQMWRWWQL